MGGMGTGDAAASPAGSGSSSPELFLPAIRAVAAIENPLMALLSPRGWRESHAEGLGPTEASAAEPILISGL